MTDDDGNDDDDDDDEEEDRPLAARIAAGSRSVPGKRSGKQAPGKKSKKSHTVQNGAEPSDQPRPPATNGWTNGINGYEARIKVEEKMDEGQLTRLTAGVPVDAVGRSSAAVCFQSSSSSLLIHGTS